MAEIIGSADADILFGTPVSDVISGGGANDRLYGGAGGDEMAGGEGADSLYGESGDDVIDGGAGDDFIRDGAGNDIVHGGEGDDRVVSEAGSDQFHGDGGDDTFEIFRDHAGSTVSVSGGHGNDHLNLRSLAAGNVLTADMGDGLDDVYFSSLRGSATLTLGAGRDILYGSSDFRNLATSGAHIRITDWQGGADGDVLTLADMLRGTAWDGSANPFTAGYLKLVQSGSDVVLYYSASANGIFANVIVFENIALAAFSSENLGGWSYDGSAAASRHVVGTEAAYEVLTGGSGSDLIEGGGGRDRVYGGAGNDEIHGGGGVDSLTGGAGVDDLHGGDGDDLIFGNAGDDIVHGGEGNDYIEDGAGNGSLYGEGGDDEINVQWSVLPAPVAIYVSGGDGHDSIRINGFNASQATIDAGAGNDAVTLNGDFVSHSVTLGDGADVVIYTLTNYGAMNGALAGITRITDFETGDSGDRLKIGSPYSNLGADPYGSGYLRLVQNGADVLLQYDLDGAATGHGWITLITLADTSVGAFTAYNLGVYSFGEVTAPELVLAGTAGDDRIHGAYGADVIGGGDGNDEVEGLGGDDELSGGLGADRLIGESGADHLLGGDGDDSLDGGDGNDLLEGGEGADTFTLGHGNDVALGGGGNDSIDVLETGNDSAYGGDGDDYLYVSRSGSNSDRILLAGEAGSDRIYVAVSTGGKAQVEVDAGTGDDRVTIGGGSANRITLGSGRDVLEFGLGYRFEGSTVVTDFQAGEGGDMLDFDAWLYGFAQTLDPNANPFLTGTMRLVQSGADVLVQIDRDGAAAAFGWSTAITLQNVDIAALRPANLDNYQLLYQHGTEAADVLEGSALDDTLWGEGGDDTIRGFAGADTLYGGEGADMIEGGEGADRIEGNSGDDVIEGGTGADLISGGEGADRLDGGAERDILSGEAGDDILAGGDDDDDLLGGDGEDELTGGAGADLLAGDLGDDSMDGGAGDDILYSDVFDSTAQHDTAIGGAGIDILQVDFLHIADGPGVTMTIAADAAGGYAGTISAGADHGVTFSTVETFVIGGTNQADQITSGDGGDLMFGRLGDDVLTAGGGSDWLIGGGGADTMAGGMGNDRYDVDGDDVLIENEGEGTDLVETRLASYTLLANFENLTGLLATGQALTGNDAENVIKGGSGNDVIDGGAGADSLQGGLGNDIYHVDNAGDAVTDTGGIDEVRTSLAVLSIAGSTSLEHLTGLADSGQVLTGNGLGNTIRGGGGDDQLNGGGGIDTLLGGAGNDSLDGGSSADSMQGGQGDDSYVVDSTSDSVVEAAGEGTDKVTTALATYSLAANVENLTGTSALGQTLRGNVSANEIIGGGGGDTFRLEDGGADKVFGNGGNDVVYFGGAMTATDEVDGGSGSDTLALQGDYSAGLTLGARALIGIETLQLLARTNSLYGGSGLSPNSYNIVTVDPNVAAGAMLVVDAIALASNERLVFNGSAETDGRFSITGGLGADSLTGGAGADLLSGGGGNDLIDGGAGADSMSGGAGDDLFIADHAGDAVYEGASGGNDEVRTSLATFTLAAPNVEILRGLSNAGQALTGGGTGLTIVAGTGRDTLDDGGAAATLKGGLGDDSYAVWATGTAVIENAGEGADTVRSFLASYTMGANVEYLHGMLATGQTLTGNAEANVIQGGSGNDVISGGGSGGGSDSLYGNDGNDRFLIGPGGGMAYVRGGGGSNVLVVSFGATTGSVTAAPIMGPHSPEASTGSYYDGIASTVVYSEIARIEITTGNQDDSIVTSYGDDKVVLNGGNDFLNVGRGNDTADGGSGFDGITADMSAASGAITWDLQANSYSGATGAFTNFEYLGRLWTGSGNDRIVTAASGRDEGIFLGGGDDGVTVVDGIDQVGGGAGIDTLTVDYSSATVQVFGSINPQTGGGFLGSFKAGTGREVSFIDFERFVVIGGSAADSLTGADGDDILDGRGGADMLNGGLGNDVYIVGAGDQLFEYGDPGVDEVQTELATYVLGANLEKLTGLAAAGQDLRGNSADNALAGASGNDLLRMQDGGSDSASGGGGDDIVYFGAAFGAGDSAQGGAGTDRLVLQGHYAGVLMAATGFEELTLLSASDASFGGGGAGSFGYTIVAADAAIAAGGRLKVDATGLRSGEALVFDGSAETDGALELRGGAGADRLTGGSSGDYISGGAGADIIEGGAGSDQLFAGAGDDWVEGGSGNDFLMEFGVMNAAGGNDSLFGGDGDDNISVYRYWADTWESLLLSGGAGDDRFYLSIDDTKGHIVVDGGDGRDFVQLDGQEMKATITLGGGRDTVSITNVSSLMNARNAIVVTDFATGAAGDGLQWQAALALTCTNWSPDTNPFATGHVRLVQNGADTLLQVDRDGGGDGYTTILTFKDTQASAFTEDNFEGYAPDGGALTPGADIIGTAGRDNLTGTSRPELIDGLDGNDYLIGGGGSDTLRGGAGDDYVEGGIGADTLEGGEGNDTLEGGYGNDVALGGGGNDTLRAADSSDSLYGEGGNDWLDYTGNYNSPPASALLDGGEGNDRLSLLLSNKSHVEAFGGGGDDIVQIYGIVGGDADVTLGAGADTLMFMWAPYKQGVADDRLRVLDFQVEDRVDLSQYVDAFTNHVSGTNPFADGHMRLVQSGADTLLQVSQSANGVFVTFARFENKVTSNFTAASFSGLAPVSVKGDFGADLIVGTASSDLLSGEGGNDVFHLQAGGDDTVFGGAGDDSIFFIGALTGADIVNGGDGGDTLVLQGPYGSLTLTANVTQIENISILGGF
ncbi:MAG TPA: calcium-binding protein, partial [Allosphingosinicella sp.]